MRPHRSRRIPFALIPLCLLFAAPAVALDVAPLARPAPSRLWDDAYIETHARTLEATIKARAAAKAALLDPGATPGMDDYDVTWYDLELDLDAVANLLSGTVTVRAVVTGASLATLDLHLSTIHTVSAARAGGTATSFAHPAPGEVLSVDLDRTYLQGEVVEVAVDYAGDPATGAYGSFGWDQADGSPLIWTLSEPYGARDWWPCKDLNTDKADSIDLHVTVDDPLVVASNGLLTTSVPEAGRTTYHWSSRYPIATYLVSLAVHPFEVVQDLYLPLGGGSMPVDHYAIPSYAPDVEAVYGVTIPILEAFAAAFGEYPFVAEKYGHAHFPWGGGMEHQTCTSILYWYYGSALPGLIAHEAAHQWWGDAVTCADFHHIWLNEGFARWCEAYWEEVQGGPSAYRAEMNSHRYLGQGTVYVEDTSDFGSIFNVDTTYDKAAWVVHMLRYLLGDADFFAGLAAYRAAYEDGSATTEDLQAVLEGVSGLDLETFFQQWIYGDYYPAYALSWMTSPAGTHVNVTVEQTQTTVPPFDMPIEIRVATDVETVTHRLPNSQALEYYALPVDGSIVLSVELDPDDWILCSKSDGGVSAQGPVPGASRIVGNAPNPFNPRTEIAFTLAEAGRAELEIFDVRGRRVRRLVADVLAAGPQRAVWDGRSDDDRAVAAGVYFARLRTVDGESLHKLSLVK